MSINNICTRSKASTANVSAEETKHDAPERSTNAAPDNVTSEISFDYLRRRIQEPSQDGTVILDYVIIELFEILVKLPSAAKLGQKAVRFIRMVAKLAPLERTELSPYNNPPFNPRIYPVHFSQKYVEVIIGIASQIPPRNSAQDVLVTIMDLRFGRHKAVDAVMCREQHHFKKQMSDAWRKAATPENKRKNHQKFTKSEWININSFVAALFNMGAVDWGHYAVGEIREGLEIPLKSTKSSGSTTGIRVHVASEWIIQSAPRLLRESLFKEPSSDNDLGPQSRTYRKGSLFSEESFFSLERWCFWKRRLDEIKTEVDQ
ncbi:hypothetical protein F4804DRAFT_329035 [Jackrogersella minutella]|nr:hypothetical protein F4804DRAFT_329035 [Jackrogersella minutella]